jgi:hypothetical protein
MIRLQNLSSGVIARAVGGLLLVSGLLFGATGVAMPSPASAHSYGHVCEGWTNGEFSCKRIHSSGLYTGVEMFRYGVSRGEIRVWYGESRPKISAVWVCDREAYDGLVPTVRIEDTGGFYREYYGSDRGGCQYIGVNLNMYRFRGLLRSTSTNNPVHGTIWYGFP